MSNSIFSSVRKLRHNSLGFTLIELLVVIAIIGILSTLAVVALGSARTKARDSQRLANMNAFQKGMELYYDKASTYVGACMDSGGAAVTLPAVISDCEGDGGSNKGVAEFMVGVANVKDPTPPATGTCASPATGSCGYTLTSLGAQNYVVDFWEEGADAAGQLTETGLVK